MLTSVDSGSFFVNCMLLAVTLRHFTACMLCIYHTVTGKSQIKPHYQILSTTAIGTACTIINTTHSPNFVRKTASHKDNFYSPSPHRTACCNLAYISKSYLSSCPARILTLIFTKVHRPMRVGWMASPETKYFSASFALENVMRTT